MAYVLNAHDSHRVCSNMGLLDSSDNGGYLGNGGNSTPYRGGKFSDFDGGTRVRLLRRAAPSTVPRLSTTSCYATYSARPAIGRLPRRFRHGLLVVS
jgi:hypothetical protein